MYTPGILVYFWNKLSDYHNIVFCRCTGIRLYSTVYILQYYLNIIATCYSDVSVTCTCVTLATTVLVWSVTNVYHFVFLVHKYSNVTDENCKFMNKLVSGKFEIYKWQWLLPRSFAETEREYPLLDLLTTHCLSRQPESHFSPPR